MNLFRKNKFKPLVVNIRMHPFTKFFINDELCEGYFFPDEQFNYTLIDNLNCVNTYILSSKHLNE